MNNKSEKEIDGKTVVGVFSHQKPDDWRSDAETKIEEVME